MLMKEGHHVNERKNSMRWMVDEASLKTFHLKYTAINSGILSLNLVYWQSRSSWLKLQNLSSNN